MLISCGAFVPLAVKWPLHTRLVSRITVKAGNIQYYSISLPYRQGAVEGKVRIGTANQLFFSFKKSAKTSAV